MAGFSFLFLLFTASVIYSLFIKDHVTLQVLLRLDSEAHIIGRPPYFPSLKLPFGTDPKGYNMFYKILDGAKITIGFAIAVALLRSVIAGVIGIVKAFYFKCSNSEVSRLFDAFRFVPMTLLAYFILQPVAFDWDKYVPVGILSQEISKSFGVSGVKFSYGETVVFEMIILTVIAIPTVTKVIASETGEILDREFIEGAKIIGGGRFHIFWRHVCPHLWPRLLIIYIREVIQVLLVVMHLGLLKVFIGGTIIKISFQGVSFDTASNEWAGMIGHYFDLLGPVPWVPFAPIFMFMLTILSLNFIMEGMKQAFTQLTVPQNKPVTVEKHPTSQQKKMSFDFIRKKERVDS